MQVSGNRVAPRDGLGGCFSADPRRCVGGGVWGNEELGRVESEEMRDDVYEQDGFCVEYR